MLKFLTAVCAASCVCCAAQAAGSQEVAGGVAVRNSPTMIARFSLAGKDLAVTAKGRQAQADSARRLRDMKESISMAKAMGGEPPAYVTFDITVSF